MIQEVTERTSELAQFCGNYAVSRLDLFGPAAIANFPPEEIVLVVSQRDQFATAATTNFPAEETALAVSQRDPFAVASIANFPAEQPALSFLVKFQPLPPGDYANAYFGLLESLEQLFERPVELVSDAAVKNPYFRQSIEETRTLLYSVYADAA